jgi:hypothetical protein
MFTDTLSDVDSNLPFLTPLAKMDASLTPAIKAILTARYIAKIDPSIVETKARPMIDNHSLTSGDYSRVHVNSATSFIITTTGVVIIILPPRIPFPLIQKIVVSSINNREQAFCEWDKTVGWQRRHNILCEQVGHSQPSTAALMCRHFTLSEVCHAL